MIFPTRDTDESRPTRLLSIAVITIFALTVLLAVAMPTVAALPDSDGDGVSDANDQCPNQAGAKSNGCVVNLNICNTGFLPQIANAIIQLCIYGGGVGMFLTVMSTSAMESLPSLGEEQRQNLKRARRFSISAGGKLFAIGPISVLIIEATGMPWAQCINLFPF
jgi:hypothetical protein